MANTKSAKKAIKTNDRNKLINKVYKTRIKTAKKSLLQKLEGETKEVKLECQELLNLYYKRVDLAVKKNLLHKNKAARKKSQMAKKFNTK